MMGGPQENWLQDGLRNSPARWNPIANQVMIAQMARTEAAGRTFPMDKWDGYAAARQRLLDVLVKERSGNPVVLTGDIHSTWIGDLKTDFDNPVSPIVAAEFVATSISSGGDGRDTTARTAAILAENPHLKFYNGQRGYLRCVVTEKSWTTDVRVVPFITRPAAPIGTRASFVVQAGVPGVQPG
jgi:alkaline phosphatase D